MTRRIDEEKVLDQAFEVLKTKETYTEEERQLIALSEAIIECRIGVIRQLDAHVEGLLDRLLHDVGDPRNWQPADHLPDFAADWRDDVGRLQEQASALSDALLVVLVGDMITEEALPTYQTTLSRLAPVPDLTGTQEAAWPRWIRGWAAEENRHGDLLHTYLHLTGRLNMRAIDDTIQSLLRTGFDPGVGRDPYKLMVYTSFQERATYISHRGTARIAREQGDEKLSEICTAIAKDELRHESFYRSVMHEVFQRDPNAAMTAYASMMKRTIAMPANRMTDAQGFDLFNDFSLIAQETGIYATQDYADIIDHLNRAWGVGESPVTTEHALVAREHLLALPERYMAVARRRAKVVKECDPKRLGWLKT